MVSYRGAKPKKPCDQWASYACEHPYLFALQFNSGEILTATKEGLDTTIKFLDVIQKIKQLSE